MPEIGNSTGGSLANLTDRLKTKTEAERRTAEKMIEDSFENLSINLTASAKHALGTIERAINRETMNVRENITAQIKLLNSGYMKRWLASAILGLGLMLGMFGAGWGLVKGAHHYLNSLRSEWTDLKQQISKEETTLRQLQSQTWGLELVEGENGRFIAPPPGKKFLTNWTIGNRPVIKLE